MNNARHWAWLIGSVGLAILVLAACGPLVTPAPTPTATSTPTATTAPAPKPAGTAAPFTLSSQSFAADETIPDQFTCNGANTSPDLHWTDLPDIKSFVLTLEDPDAPGGTYTHWVLYDIPGTLRELPAAVPDDGTHGMGALNSFGRTSYGGPCPPAGTVHHYLFTLYALDVAKLPLPAKPARKDVETALPGHILGETHLVGLYQHK
jgi:Raf kinase inhibitor-like YbhB/YbcL family protein